MDSVQPPQAPDEELPEPGPPKRYRAWYTMALAAIALAPPIVVFAIAREAAIQPAIVLVALAMVALAVLYLTGLVHARPDGG